MELGDPDLDGEARWNLMMPPYQLRVLFDEKLDPEGAAIRESWASENGLAYDLAPGGAQGSTLAWSR